MFRRLRAFALRPRGAAPQGSDVAADAVWGASCDVCGEAMKLPVTKRDSRGTPTRVSIVEAEGWTFNTDDGWRCPAHSESAAPVAAARPPIDVDVEAARDVSGEGER